MIRMIPQFRNHQPPRPADPACIQRQLTAIAEYLKANVWTKEKPKPVGAQAVRGPEDGASGGRDTTPDDGRGRTGKIVADGLRAL